MQCICTEFYVILLDKIMGVNPENNVLANDFNLIMNTSIVSIVRLRL